MGATLVAKNMLLTIPLFVPLSSRIGSFNGARSAEKYKHVVLLAGRSTEILFFRGGAPGTNRRASGSSTATTTPRSAVIASPPAILTTGPPSDVAGSTPSAFVSNRTDPGGSPDAICSGMAEMPPAGSTLSPSARHLKIKSNRRELVSNSRSKKIPPKNGLKNLSITEEVKPEFRRREKIDVSWEEKISLSSLIWARSREIPMRNLSGMVPIGLNREAIPSVG